MAHELAAPLNQFQAGRKIKDVSRQERVVFTETMTGHPRRAASRRLLCARNVIALTNRARWRRELGGAELAFRIVHAQRSDRIAENRISLRRPVGEAIEQIGAHAFRLRALTGKQKRDGHEMRWTTLQPWGEPRHTIAMAPLSSCPVSVNDVRVWYAETAPLGRRSRARDRVCFEPGLEPDERARFDRLLVLMPTV